MPTSPRAVKNGTIKISINLLPRAVDPSIVLDEAGKCNKAIQAPDLGWPAGEFTDSSKLAGLTPSRPTRSARLRSHASPWSGKIPSRNSDPFLLRRRRRATWSLLSTDQPCDPPCSKRNHLQIIHVVLWKSSASSAGYKSS